jgi:hypothetical protein
MKIGRQINMLGKRGSQRGTILCLLSLLLVLIVSMNIPTRQKVLGCLWCPSNAQVREIGFHFIQTEIIDAANNVKYGATINIAQVLIWKRFPRKLNAAVGRQHSGRPILWQPIVPAARGIDWRGFTSRCYDNVSIRYDCESHSLTKIFDVDLYLRRYALWCSFQRRNTILIYKWPTLGGEKLVLSPSFTSIEDNGTECCDFQPEAWFPNLSPEILAKWLWWSLGSLCILSGWWLIRVEITNHHSDLATVICGLAGLFLLFSGFWLL